jgi:hypothetical protein
MSPNISQNGQICKCDGCEIKGGFNCTEAMDIKLLMKDLRLSLLQAQDSDPCKPHNGPKRSNTNWIVGSRIRGKTEYISW